MKIIRTLKITPEEFLDQLRVVLRKELSQAASVPSDPASLQAGMAFELDPDKASITRTYQIVELGLTGCVLEISMPYEHISRTYTVEPDDEGRITVTYMQEIASLNTRRRGFMRTFSEMVYLGNMASMLLDIESAVLDAREGFVRPQAPERAQRRHLLMEKLVERLDRDQTSK